jgi:uncharacterized protein (TIGR03000 family)
MSRFRFRIWAVLLSTIFLAAMTPAVYSHGGHGGFGHAGHHGFGYGGYHGYHGFGYGPGYRGFGFGYPFFGGFGYPGFGFGGLGYGLYDFGGLGYGLYGFSGLGYGLFGLGGLGYGGLGYGGLGFGGLGYGGYGYGGFFSACNCCCPSAYPYYGGTYSLYGGSIPVPVYGGGTAPANSGSDPLPMPRGVSWSSRYVDYYARNANTATRYVDYYARNAGRTAENKALLHVSLPADAELWLNGKRMGRTGPERDFISPQLQEGETYTYEIKARWTQDGRPQEETIEAKVRANKTTNVRLGESSLAKR